MIGCQLTPRTEETAPETAGSLRVSVTDTGVGIPPEKLGRLFTPFDRLDAQRTTVEGTGLGLAISKKMIELMGGVLGLESTVGKGSEFWIELPAADCPTKGLDLPYTEGPAEAYDSKVKTVVYIEDNLSNLKVIEAIFTLRNGIKLFAAMQGGLGIDLVREHLPDLVLLDLNLPDLSGQEVLGRLRRDPRTRHVPVLVLTADASPGQRERLLAASANGFLTKPLDVPIFLKIVDQMLASEARSRLGREVAAEGAPESNKPVS